MGKNCFICGGKIIRNNEFSFKCLECKFYFSNLKSGYGQDVQGIESIRKKNFIKILHRIIKIKNYPKILEIGSGDGFFIEECLKLEIPIVGSEASDDSLKNLKNKFGKKTNLLKISLPEHIKKKINKRFDFIIFNDVFEHLNKLDDVIMELKTILKHDGSIIINLPSSNGIIFKISEFMMKFGFSKFYERLWQKNLSSPHLSYFNQENLDKLFFKHNFYNSQSGYLESLSVNSYDRIKNLYDNKLIIVILSIICFLFAMIQKILPKDIIFSFYRLKNKKK